jgi:tetratricopeptide (TPR) repeat protein
MLGRWAETARHYRAANRIHRIRRDTFGTAYSFCGLGNVERMAGRWDDALLYFRRAEKLYKTIGDKVSYAYTLWSIGTALKMKGDFGNAKTYFSKADVLFRQTGDTRGRAYAFLGFAELKWLAGGKGEADRRKAGMFARKGGYAWEALHARVVRGGKIDSNAQALYRRAGSRFYPKALPVNWP